MTPPEQRSAVDPLVTALWGFRWTGDAGEMGPRLGAELNRLGYRLVSVTEPAAPDPRHRPDDPGCPCWDCHLNAEAEDATWD